MARYEARRPLKLRWCWRWPFLDPESKHGRALREADEERLGAIQDATAENERAKAAARAAHGKFTPKYFEAEAVAAKAFKKIYFGALDQWYHDQEAIWRAAHKEACWRDWGFVLAVATSVLAHRDRRSLHRPRA